MSLRRKLFWQTKMISAIGFRLVGEPALRDARLDLKNTGIHILPYQLEGNFPDLPFFHHHQTVAGQNRENNLPRVSRVNQCLRAPKGLANAIGLSLSSAGDGIIVIGRIEHYVLDIVGVVCGYAAMSM